MNYKGSCHCGKIAFEVEGEIQNVIDCNCSICRRRGHLLWFVPAAQFKLKTSDQDIPAYLFNKKVIKHRFCPVCGVGPFGQGMNPKTKEATYAVNVRCLENVDLAKLTIVPFDGKSV